MMMKILSHDGKEITNTKRLLLSDIVEHTDERGGTKYELVLLKDSYGRERVPLATYSKYIYAWRANELLWEAVRDGKTFTMPDDAEMRKSLLERAKNGESKHNRKTISGIIEDVSKRVCDDDCEYPDEYGPAGFDDMTAEKCEDCLLGRL